MHIALNIKRIEPANIPDVLDVKARTLNTFTDLAHLAIDTPHTSLTCYAEEILLNSPHVVFVDDCGMFDTLYIGSLGKQMFVLDILQMCHLTTGFIKCFDKMLDKLATRENMMVVRSVRAENETVLIKYVVLGRVLLDINRVTRKLIIDEFFLENGL